MLKYQMGLIVLLIGCFAFISCDMIQEVLTPAVPEEEMMPTEETMPEEMMPTEEMATEEMATEEMATEGMMPEEMMEMYTSWANVTYAAVAVAAHGEGDRVVYINDIGAMALQDGMTTFPVGTVIVKEIMDATNTSVAVVERMEKTDEYAAESGWLYNEGANQALCHSCHAKAGSALPGMDAVFTDFSALAAEGQ